MAMRFERMFRDRTGTVLYAVVRTAGGYAVVQWDVKASPQRLVTVDEYDGPELGAKWSAIERARSLVAGGGL